MRFCFEREEETKTPLQKDWHRKELHLFCGKHFPASSRGCVKLDSAFDRQNLSSSANLLAESAPPLQAAPPLPPAGPAPPACWPRPSPRPRPSRASTPSPPAAGVVQDGGRPIGAAARPAAAVLGAACPGVADHQSAFAAVHSPEGRAGRAQRAAPLRTFGRPVAATALSPPAGGPAGAGQDRVWAPRKGEALRGAGRGGPPEGEREEGAQASLRVWSRLQPPNCRQSCQALLSKVRGRQ